MDNVIFSTWSRFFRNSLYPKFIVDNLDKMTWTGLENMSFLKSVNISKSFLSHIGKSKRFYQLKFLYQRIPFFTCFLYQESTVHFYIIALKWYAFNSNYLDTIKQIFRNNFRFYVHCLQIISIEQSKVKLVWKKAIATSIVFIVSWVMKYLTREYIFFSIK